MFYFVGLASRILQVGPRGSKFLGSVLIEVPHVASLCNDDREVVVLRCDSASKGKWTEHVQEKLDDKTLKVLTLSSLMIVGLRLLIETLFIQGYFVIREAMFIIFHYFF